MANVGARPASISYGSGSLWVANLDENTVARVDLSKRAVVKRIPVSATQTALAAGPGGVWIANGPVGTVSRLDPTYNSVAHTIAIKHNKTGTVAVAVTKRAVWIVNGDGTVSRIDPTRNRVATTVDAGGAGPIAVGERALWVVNGGFISSTVKRVDPTGAVTAKIPVGHNPSAIAVGDGAVWVADTGDDSVVRIDPDTNVTETIAVGKRPIALAISPGAVWVANSGDGTVSRIDPKSKGVKTIKVGSSPVGLAFADGSLWVSVQASAFQYLPGSQAGTAQIVLNGGASGGQYTVDYTDPALAYTISDWQLEYATCAKLLNYPDKPAPVGTQLVPEVAKTLPVISNGGKTYTFTIRRGFRFSPPSKEEVTAQTFKYAIERSQNPRMVSAAARPEYLDDVVGEKAYAAGKAKHIAGVVAKGDTLTIRLTRPNGDLPARLTMPFFCAVPIGTPLNPKGELTTPSAGPYYVASYTPQQQVVLKRNPNYHGSRPRRFEQIVYSIGASAERNVAEVGAGRADYFPVLGLLPPSLAGLSARYGPGSAAARAGRQQYYVSPFLGLLYFALNTSRPLFADASMRKAVNYAIDRRALVRISPNLDKPIDQYLPPGAGGYRNANIYPLDRPDLAKAKALAAGRGGHAIMLASDGPAAIQRAQVVKNELKAIGIDVEVKFFPPCGYCGAWDIAEFGWLVDYNDPAAFLDPLFNGNTLKTKNNADFSHFNDPSFNSRLEQAANLTGPERYRVYGQLDVELARDAAPLVAYGTWGFNDFFSARIGCQLSSPVYGTDLGALCIRKKK